MIRKIACIALFLVAAPAAAQDFIHADDCVPYNAFEGTVPFGVAVQGRNTAAQTFGAAQFAEKAITPLLQHGPMAFSFHGNAIYDSAHVPAISSQAGCTALERYQRTPVDSAAGAVGIGYGGEWWSLFYAASFTRTRLRTTDTAAGFAPYVAALESFAGFAAPFLGGGSVDGINGRARDYILGGRAEVFGTELRLGYVGSTGVYFHASESEYTKLFTSLAVGQKFDVLAYLKGGVGPFDLDELVFDGLGSSYLYAQQTAFTSPLRLDAAREVIDEPLATTSFWTLSFEQRNMFGNFEIALSAALRPQAFFHHAELAWSTGNFHADQPEGPKSKYGPGWVDGRVAVGFIEMPELRFLGVPGGKKRITIDLEGRITIGSRKDSGQLALGWSFKANDPTTLMMFPASASATHFLYLEFQIGSFEGSKKVKATSGKYNESPPKNPESSKFNQPPPTNDE